MTPQTQPPTPPIALWAALSETPTPAQNWQHSAGLPNLPFQQAQQPSPGTGAKNQAPAEMDFIPKGCSTRSTNLTIAGLCVFAGTLILTFVYFMALGLPGTPPAPSINPGVTGTINPAPTSTFKPTPTGATHHASTAPTTTAVAPTPAPTVEASPSTAALPGEHFIDNAQMASAIDLNTARTLEPATSFNVNQKIYVTFQLHPPGQSGAVCLLWYLNGKKVSRFAFPVSSNAGGTAYSYAVYTKSGAGYVNIYWASTTGCVDILLAQHVDFSVIG